MGIVGLVFRRRFDKGRVVGQIIGIGQRLFRVGFRGAEGRAGFEIRSPPDERAGADVDVAIVIEVREVRPLAPKLAGDGDFLEGDLSRMAEAGTDEDGEGEAGDGIHAVGGR